MRAEQWERVKPILVEHLRLGMAWTEMVACLNQFGQRMTKAQAGELKR